MCASISLMFIFVGNLNKLAPIVTMPFLTTYMAINYGYFAMAMSYDVKLKQTLRVEGSLNNHQNKNNNNNSRNSSGSDSVTKLNGKPTANGYGALTSERSFEDTSAAENVPPTVTRDGINSPPDAGSKTFEVEEPPAITKATEGETDDSFTAAASNDVDVELNVESNLVSAEDIGNFYIFFNSSSLEILLMMVFIYRVL